MIESPEFSQVSLGSVPLESMPMPSQSEWHTPTRVDPTETIDRFGRRWLAISILAMIALTFIFVLLQIPIGIFIGSLPMLMVGVLGGQFTRRSQDPAREVLEDVNDRFVCYVDVTIYQAGVVTGYDRGAAYFDGDRLIFSGNRMSFALGGQDVYSVDALEAIGIRHPNRTVHLQVKPVDRGGKEFASATSFMRDLRRFARSGHLSREPRQYPPLSLGPMIRIPRFGLNLSWKQLMLLSVLVTGFGLVRQEEMVFRLGVSLFFLVEILQILGASKKGDALLNRRKILLALQRKSG